MQPLREKDSFDDTPMAFLYDCYAHIILNYVACNSSSKEDADDLVLETFVAAIGYELCAFDLGQGKILWDKQLPKTGDQQMSKTERDGISNLQVRDGVIAMQVNDGTKSTQNEYTKYLVLIGSDTR